ncbi:phospholipid carrier-dependent glycosyltransferase [Patescibacteria group bacterium]|nr:phospholipid carrier-dependent glycosyltransferase [Patescibacteria group bacterium]
MNRLFIFIFGTFVLVIIFLLQGISFINSNSQTYDEGITIAAGYAYLNSGEFGVNPEHPPLIKMWTALPIYLLEKMNIIDPKFSFMHEPNQFMKGYKFLYNSNISHEKILFASRFQNLILGALLIVFVSLWAFRLWGVPSGLLAGALATFEPNIIANSSISTLDIGVTLFVFASIYFLWEYMKKPTWFKFTLTFITIGCAFASKFSAILLVPILIIVATWVVKNGQSILLPYQSTNADIQVKKRMRISLESVLILIGGGLVVFQMFYGFGNIEHIINGFMYQFMHAVGGHWAYLFGHYRTSGWLIYFIVSFLVKTPLITIALIILSLIYWKRGCKLKSLEAALLLSPIIVFMFVMSIGAINIGIRYILPVYPFLIIIAARIATFDLRSRLTNIIAFVGTVLILIISTFPYSDHALSYFNEAAGGPENGWRILSDANVDWGNGLKDLKKYMEDNDIDTVHLSYFGTASPAAYGINYEFVPTATTFELPNAIAKGDPFILAISVTNLQGTLFYKNTDIYQWLWDREPIAKPGYSIHIYDFTDDTEAQKKLEEVAEEVKKLY